MNPQISKTVNSAHCLSFTPLENREVIKVLSLLCLQRIPISYRRTHKHTQKSLQNQINPLFIIFNSNMAFIRLCFFICFQIQILFYLLFYSFFYLLRETNITFSNSTKKFVFYSPMLFFFQRIKTGKILLLLVKPMF